MASALYRFSTFWNLLLDDFRLDLRSEPEEVELSLVPYAPGFRPQRFRPYAAAEKLAHGLLSWLGGFETQVKEVRFAFEQPDFNADYAVVFPCPVRFAMPQTSIVFDPDAFTRPVSRSRSEASAFLERAPLDWIFTGSRAHTHSLRVRAFLYGATWQTCQLPEAGRCAENDAADPEPAAAGGRHVVSGHQGRPSAGHRHSRPSAGVRQHRSDRLRHRFFRSGKFPSGISQMDGSDAGIIPGLRPRLLA